MFCCEESLTGSLTLCLLHGHIFIFVHSLDSSLCTSHSHHQGLQISTLVLPSLLLPQGQVMIININEFCEPGKIVMVRKLSRGIAFPLVLSFFFYVLLSSCSHFFPRVVSVQ